MTNSATLDSVFDALANESRREIVDHLSSGTATTPELGRRFAFTKQALNRHLQVLEEAGLVERRLQGRVHELHLVGTPFDELSGWAATVAANWNHNFDRLGQILKEQS